MLDWIRLVEGIRESDDRPLPERLAETHVTFESVHPFLDGNGRAGRLLLNLILVRLGYPPAIVYRRERDRYMKALHRADGGDFGPLGELIARAVTDNLHRFVMPAVAGPARLLPLAALEREGLTANSLRKAILRGSLRAQQQPDGTWFSTKVWVDDYVATRYRRRMNS
ncbi:Fic family protein [Phytoactinopolyspora endophytica]|uniref:Fic family protein n=1 Tax=Phytoactinopolyspora endophytica TaxID=1642495 RepID=UPI003B8326DF